MIFISVKIKKLELVKNQTNPKMTNMDSIISYSKIIT